MPELTAIVPRVSQVLLIRRFPGCDNRGHPHDSVKTPKSAPTLELLRFISTLVRFASAASTPADEFTVSRKFQFVLGASRFDSKSPESTIPATATGRLADVPFVFPFRFHRVVSTTVPR